jgi:hypothetical protein
MRSEGAGQHAPGKTSRHDHSTSQQIIQSVSWGGIHLTSTDGMNSSIFKRRGTTFSLTDQTMMSTNQNHVVEGVELDWRWVDEPDSWMGLRAERALARRRHDREELARLKLAFSASEPVSSRFAVGFAHSFLSLFRG